MAFTFYENIEDVFVFRKGVEEIVRFVPVEIKTKDVLLTSIAAIFDYPGFFGKNWDALRDELLHKEFPGAKKVILVHQDVPLKNDRESIQVYLDILSEVIERRTNLQFQVAFPTSCSTSVQI